MRRLSPRRHHVVEGYGETFWLELDAGQREARQVDAAMADEEESLADLAEGAERDAADEQRLEHLREDRVRIVKKIRVVRTQRKPRTDETSMTHAMPEAR